MSKIYILIVEDEPAVMESVLRDISVFEDVFPIETAQTAEEAEEVTEMIKSQKNHIGVIICDHILPGKNGIEFLSELTGDEYYKFTRKVLLTGQASHEDTINAINNASIAHYFSKPWNTDELQESIRDVLTDYVIDTQENLLPFMASLNAVKIGEALRNRSLADN